MLFNCLLTLLVVIGRRNVTGKWRDHGGEWRELLSCRGYVTRPGDVDLRVCVKRVSQSKDDEGDGEGGAVAKNVTQKRTPKILGLIRGNAEVSTVAMALILHVNKRTILRDIEKMIQEGGG